jgi:hypothetical protein
VTKPDHRAVPPVLIGDEGDRERWSAEIPFRMSFTLIARSLMGISRALHRIADAMERER